ncbi:penicillopepsin [Lasiosphaeria ovina]|uniref:Penicillopepsin n=1 Tax=Lasiosphaeria ovina TaxID=92902 RepID=A0AAE0NFQ7_9PEZI|nr:penicillopepsin [Lasiosphaeria ovina]
MAKVHLSLFTVIFFSFCLSWVAAAPSSIRKRSFKVERVRNANLKARNGPRELLKAYRKFSMPLPPALLDAVRNGGNAAVGAADVQTKAKGTGATKPNILKGLGSLDLNANATATNSTGIGKVTATPEQGDIEYLAPVTIGGQTLDLDFDTGSSDLWVFNTQLSSAASDGHQLYNPLKSKTFKMLKGASFSIQYGDESGASGNVGTDTVDIGGVTVPNQAIEMATKVTTSFTEDVDSNGLVGLAFSKLNTVKPQQQKTFFDNVLPSLAEPLFTADLRSNAVGAYEFGRIDTTKFTGDLTWIPVNTLVGFWQFSTSSFSVGDATSPQALATGQAIADTGTTLMLVSPEVAAGYYSQVEGAVESQSLGGIVFPCTAELPDLFVDVGGVYTARIKGEDINFAQVASKTCFGGVQPTQGDLQIWGDIFFKSQFVVFNGGNNTLAMAEHV